MQPSAVTKSSSLLHPLVQLRGSRVAVGLAAVTFAACMPDDDREPPPLPEDAVHVADHNTLHIYKTHDEPVCAGDLRRLRMLWDTLPPALGADNLEATLILYDYDAQLEVLPSLCHKDQPIGGCAYWWGARSTILGATHELVHVVAMNVTASAPPALVREGLADALEGESIALFKDEFDISIAALLAEKDTLLPSFREDAHHFMAWVIEHHGLDAALDAYQAADRISRTDPDALAAAFGYSSIEAMQLEYASTAAYEYPPWLDFTVMVDAGTLAAGVDLTPNCEAEHTTARAGGLHTAIMFTIPSPGRYTSEHSGLTDLEFWPQLVSTEPRYEPLPMSYDPAEDWGEYVCFQEAGVYRIAFDRDYGDTTPAYVRLAYEGDLQGCP